MSTEDVTTIRLSCDNCRAVADYEDGGGELLFVTEGQVAAFLAAEAEHDGAWPSWTEDGHGKHHCPSCPPLTLDPAIAEERRAEAARQATDADVPLDLEGL